MALDVKIDHADPTTLHDQVAGAIRKAIAEGEAKPGDRLPPARDLAAVLGVNSNTVLRALRDLRDEGILELGTRSRDHGGWRCGESQRRGVGSEGVVEGHEKEWLSTD